MATGIPSVIRFARFPGVPICADDEHSLAVQAELDTSLGFAVVLGKASGHRRDSVDTQADLHGAAMLRAANNVGA